MTYTIAQLKSAVVPKLGGSTSSDIQSWNDTIHTAAMRMWANIDIRGTKREATLSSPIYDGITRYALPSDFEGAIDLLPQAGERTSGSNFSTQFSRQFSLRNEFPTMAIDWKDTVPTIDIRRTPGGNIITLEDFEETTGWTASIDASNLYKESLNYIGGSCSMGFDLDGLTGSFTLVKTTLNSQDVSLWRVRDSVFMWVYIPGSNASRFASFTLRRGNDVANYHSKTITVQQDGQAFTNGWNLLRFDMSSATETGTVDLTDITYAYLSGSYTAGAAISGMAVDSMTDQLGDYFKLSYYSNFLYSNPTSGAWIDFPVDDNTIINVDPSAFLILQKEILSDLVTELMEKKSSAQLMYQRYDKELKDLYDLYVRRYPSERISPSETYYDFDL